MANLLSMPPLVCFDLAASMVFTKASAPSTLAQSQYFVSGLDPVTHSPNPFALRLHPSRRPPLSRQRLSFFRLPSRALTSPKAMTPNPRPSSLRPGLRLLLPWVCLYPVLHPALPSRFLLLTVYSPNCKWFILAAHQPLCFHSRPPCHVYHPTSISQALSRFTCSPLMIT